MVSQTNFPIIKPSLNLDFANVRRLDPRITFTNASDGRAYFDEFGVMRKAAANVPRFDHDPVTGESLGLLIEEQRTNLLTRSQEIDQWGDSPANGTIVTPNVLMAPDGTMTADLVVATSTTSGHLRYRTFAGAINTTYVGSVFIKYAGLEWVRVGFGNSAFNNLSYAGHVSLLTGQVGTIQNGAIVNATDVGNGWYRISVVATSDGDGGNYVFGVTLAAGDNNTSFIGDDVSGAYVWGAQVEEGTFPTSYIKTEASQVTRAADSALMTGTNFSSWFNNVEGTLYTEARSNTVRGSVDTFPVVFSITDGTNNDTIRMIQRNLIGDDNDLVFIVRAGNVQQASLNLNSSNLTVGQFYKSAGAYKLNDFAGSMDAGSVVTDVSGTIPTVNAAYIGKEVGFLSPLNGHIKRIAYYPRRLSNSELQAITA